MRRWHFYLCFELWNSVKILNESFKPFTYTVLYDKELCGSQLLTFLTFKQVVKTYKYDCQTTW